MDQKDNWSNLLKLSYYHGKFLSHPKSVCYGFKCHKQNLLVYHSNNYHLIVFAQLFVIYHTYLRTEAVVLPTGVNVDKQMFYSYEVEAMDYFNFLETSHSWMNSIIYHINCSKSSNETVYWSGLNKNLTRKVYLEEDTKSKKSVVLRNNINKYILQPPNNINLDSNFWKMQVSFYGELLRNCSKDFSTYGVLVFSSDPIKICNKKWNTKMQYKHLLKSCATFQTTINLNTKLFTKVNIYQVMFKKFENVKFIYYPNISIKLLTPETRLIYNWISYENVKHNDYRLKTEYKFLNFAKLEYSW